MAASLLGGLLVLLFNIASCECSTTLLHHRAACLLEHSSSQHQLLRLSAATY